MMSLSPLGYPASTVVFSYKGERLASSHIDTLKSKFAYFDSNLTVEDPTGELEVECYPFLYVSLSVEEAAKVLQQTIGGMLVESFSFAEMVNLYNTCVYFQGSTEILCRAYDLLNHKDLDSSWLDTNSKLRLLPGLMPWSPVDSLSTCRWNVRCDWQNVDFSKKTRMELLSEIDSHCFNRLDALHAVCHASNIVKQIKSSIDATRLLEMYTFLQDPQIIWSKGQVGLIVAGGAIVSLLKGCPSEDLDFFVYGTRSVTDDDKELRAILQSIFEAIDRAYSNYLVVKHIIGNLVNVHIMKDEMIYRKIQFIVGPYCETPVQVIEFFDLDYVQAWYDGVSIWQTPACLYAHETNMVHIVCSLASDSDKRMQKAKAKGFQFSPLATPLEERAVNSLFDLNWFESVVANNVSGSREMIATAALKNKKLKNHNEVLDVLTVYHNSWTLTETTLVHAYNTRLDGGFPYYANNQPPCHHVTPFQTSKALSFLTIKIYRFSGYRLPERDVFYGYFNKEVLEHELAITMDEERKKFLEYVLTNATLIPEGELDEYSANTTRQIRLDVHPATIVCPVVQGFTFPFSLCLANDERLDSLKKSWSQAEGLTIMTRPLTYPKDRSFRACLILDKIIW